MKDIKYRSSIFLFILICFPILFSACAGFDRSFRKDPFQLITTGLSQHPPAQAQEVLNEIRNSNKALKTIKGIGTLRFSNKDESFSSRMAWTGNSEGKIRLEIMGPYGQPTVSLAADTRHLFFYSHAEKKFYEKRLTDTALTTYLKIPITVTEMVDILCGRVPLDNDSQIALTDTTDGNGLILHVFNKDTRRLVRLYLDKQKETIHLAEFSNLGKDLSFQIAFMDLKKVDAFNIPFQINIVDANGSNFRLEMDRVWTNVEVDERMFELARPD